MYRFRDTLPIDISEQTISGDLVTIENPEEMGVVDSLEVSLEPIQDLNGYDKPWVGGAGKNKLPPYATTQTKNGITFTVNSDGTIKANGTATATTVLYLSTFGDLWSSGSYILNGCPSGGGNNKYCLRLYATGGITLVSDFGSGVTFTGQTQLECAIVICNGQTVSNIVFKPMIRLASVSDATYEPYENICPVSGWTSVTTKRTNRNCLPANGLDSVTTNGITFTKNADGSITANGTATAVTLYWILGANNILKLPNGRYTLNGCPSGGSNSTYRISSYTPNGNGFAHDYGGGASFDYLAEGVKFGIVVYAGATLNNVTFKPMLRLASDTDDTYEPYNGQTYTTALGRTVYGGTLDVVSGVLTVTHAMVDLGSLNWDLSDGIRARTRVIDYTREVASWSGDWHNTKSNVFSCEDPNLAYSARSDYSFANIPQNYYNFDIKMPSGVFADGTAVKNWLADIDGNGTHAYICIELATPQTYQLTPQQIDLLLGTNHLWSDGEISVVWHKDLTKGRILPTEAVSINGQYIENVLDGYRTLYTKGRESLGAELNTYSVGTADGEKFKSKRYPARELTVGFQLIGDNAEDFREKFNNLNNLLSLDEADFIFHDETDKFFSGYPIMDAEVEAGQNSVKGEWRIYCAYPFKRSVEPITLTMDDATVTNTTATWAIDYKGAQPARPILRAKFAGAESGGSSGEDGDCGFVAFMDARENIIQLGNPEVLDLDEYAKAGTLVNKEFVNTSGWTVNGGHNHGGAISGSISTSNTVDAYWNGGEGQTQSYAKPTYGDTGGRVTMHGPTLWKNTTGAVNFTLSAVHRLCVEKSNEYGKFELGAYNHETGTMVAGFTITKTSNGTTGTVRYIANGEVVGTDKIDLSYNNTHFGYCKRSEVYTTQTYKEKAWVKVQVPIGRNKYQTKSQLQWVTKTRQVFKGYTYTQSNLNSSIQKAGAYVYFQVGNLPKRTFNVPDIEQMVAHDASCYMGAYKTAMNTNMVHSIVFRRQAVTAFAEQPNVFTAGDIVEADCNEATVNIYHAGSMGGHLEPQYGALGNDWENFLLTSGANVIQATWSDWVNPTYKPQIEIEYNEVFI